MKLFARDPESTAKSFNWMLWVFLARLPLLIGSTFFHWLIFPALALEIIFLILFTGLTHQIGFHVLLSAGVLAFLIAAPAFKVPFVNLLAFIIIYIQAKSYLRNHGYKIGLLGAYPAPQEEDVIAQMERLIAEGKIKINPENIETTTTPDPFPPTVQEDR